PAAVARGAGWRTRAETARARPRGTARARRVVCGRVAAVRRAVEEPRRGVRVGAVVRAVPRPGVLAPREGARGATGVASRLCGARGVWPSLVRERVPGRPVVDAGHTGLLVGVRRLAIDVV